MKRIFCGLLAGVMALSLMACGQSANKEANAADSTTKTTASTEPIELTMYFPVSVGGGPDALIDALCAQYHEENPNVTVKPVYAGSYADTRTKVQAAIKGGNTSDLAIMFSIDLYSLLAMDPSSGIIFCGPL